MEFKAAASRTGVLRLFGTIENRVVVYGNDAIFRREDDATKVAQRAGWERRPHLQSGNLAFRVVRWKGTGSIKDALTDI
ncbi:hypothetical protein CL628_03470 [bacterium]|nr:hypothetical protein [bacterium]